MNKRLMTIGLSVAFLLGCSTFVGVSKYNQIGFFAPEPVPATAQLFITSPILNENVMIKKVKKINGINSANYDSNANILTVEFNARKISDYGIIASLEETGVTAQIPEEYRSLKIQQINVDF